MTYLEKLARAFNPAATDAMTYESQLRFLDNLEKTNPEKFQRILSSNPSLRQGLDTWRAFQSPQAAPQAATQPTPQPKPAAPPQPATSSAPPPPPTPPPSNPSTGAPHAEPAPAPKGGGRGLGTNLSGGLSALFAPVSAAMAVKNLSDKDYAQAGLDAAWGGEAALGTARAFAPHMLPAFLGAPVTGTAATGALGGTATLGAGLASAPVVGSWMYDIAHAADALRKEGPKAYLQSSDEYMGDNNWKTIPKSVLSPLTAGAALINRGTQVIEQNAANQAQADANAMQESRLNRLQEMDQEFARKGGFKSPDEMYANMYGYNDVNAYQQALRSGEFVPEKTMGEARALLQRGKVNPVYGALVPKSTAPYVADVGAAPMPETPAVVNASKPVVAPTVPNPASAVGAAPIQAKANAGGAPYVPNVGNAPLPQTPAVATAGLPKAPQAPGTPVQAKAAPRPRITPELRPAAQPAAARLQPRLTPQLQQQTSTPAVASQADPVVNQQQWEKRFLTETGTKYNPVSRADRASMQRMMGGNQTYNMEQWRAAGRPDAQPDFSVAYSDKPLTPNVQTVAKKSVKAPVKTGELSRRNTGVVTPEGEIWTNPADKNYLVKDARYNELTWEEYLELPASEKVENIDTFFKTAEKTI